MKLENDVAPQEYGLLLVKENVFFYDEKRSLGGVGERCLSSEIWSLDGDLSRWRSPSSFMRTLLRWSSLPFSWRFLHHLPLWW